MKSPNLKTCYSPACRQLLKKVPKRKNTSKRKNIKKGKRGKITKRKKNNKGKNHRLTTKRNNKRKYITKKVK